jgi:hypothetical protein
MIRAARLINVGLLPAEWADLDEFLHFEAIVKAVAKVARAALKGTP